jgi:phenol hydroxylase P1 protein
VHIDLRTVTIQPLRQTFSHLERRFGNKPASRYQEGTYDIQAAENLHYRPTWDPAQKLYDPGITKIVMKDWYALKDPRQYYYNTYVLTRARQQDTAEANFNFVETRGLADMLPDALRQTTLKLLVPLRHAAWGANLNNMLICGYGYGVAFTQPCIMQAMDNLGIAQYLSRLGLLLGDEEALEAGKHAWMVGPAWQAFRRYVEDTLALRDPFEVFVAQNVALDGLLYPLVYGRIVDDFLSVQGAAAVAMLTQFMTEWYDETRKWVDGVLKIAAAESVENQTVLREWISVWSARAVAAVLPAAGIALGTNADEAMSETLEMFRTRMTKTGITL